MTADAVFSDVFTMPTLGHLSENLNSLFLIQQTSHTCCTLCGNRIIKTGNTIVLYITCSNPISKNFENHASRTRRLVLKKNCFSAWASTLNMGLINKVDMVCLSPVGYGV